MKGTILNFNPASREGVISGEDGNRYSFEAQEWKSAVSPASGSHVDFSINGGAATDIYQVASGLALNGNSKKLPAALLAFFLGCFGAHKFYLGYTGQGLIMLLVFLFGFILVGIPSLVIGVIAFIEFIIYLTKSDEDFERTYVVGKKAWF